MSPKIWCKVALLLVTSLIPKRETGQQQQQARWRIAGNNSHFLEKPSGTSANGLQKHKDIYLTIGQVLYDDGLGVQEEDGVYIYTQTLI